VTEGYVHANATPIHLGSKPHIWQIKITDDKKELVSISTLTMAILELNDSVRKKLRALF
jgi:uncharacterized protein (TIGR00369 family)